MTASIDGANSRGHSYPVPSHYRVDARCREEQGEGASFAAKHLKGRAGAQRLRTRQLAPMADGIPALSRSRRQLEAQLRESQGPAESIAAPRKPHADRWRGGGGLSRRLRLRFVIAALYRRTFVRAAAGCWPVVARLRPLGIELIPRKLERREEAPEQLSVVARAFQSRLRRSRY